MRTIAILGMGLLLSACAMTPEQKRTAGYVAIGLAAGAVIAVAASKSDNHTEDEQRGMCVIYVQGGC